MQYLCLGLAAVAYIARAVRDLRVYGAFVREVRAYAETHGHRQVVEYAAAVRPRDVSGFGPASLLLASKARLAPTRST